MLGFTSVSGRFRRLLKASLSLSVMRYGFQYLGHVRDVRHFRHGYI